MKAQHVCLAASLALATLGAASAGFAQAGRATEPATYVTDVEMQAAIRKGLAARPQMATGPVKNTDHYRVNLIHRTAPAGAIVHDVGTEVHHITDGAGTLVTGGTLVRPADGGPATIAGGVSRRVTKGDVVLIPEKTPHWYQAVDGSVTYLEVRFNVPADQ